MDLFEISKRSYHVKQEEYNLFLERKTMYKLFRDNMFMDEPEFQTLLSYGPPFQPDTSSFQISGCKYYLFHLGI